MRRAAGQRLTLFGLLATLAGTGLAAAPAPLEVVPNLDLSRYAGRWFEIAKLPNRFQRKCAGDTTATYAPRGDGTIAVTNRCRTTTGENDEATGIARRVDGAPPSVLQVRFAPAFLGFLPFVWGDYQVIALGDDYEYAMVGTPDREYLWILSRAPSMAEPAIQRLLEAARAQGFDTGAVERTSQSGT